jgi:hypothetical protein
MNEHFINVNTTSEKAPRGRNSIARRIAPGELIEMMSKP